MNSLSPICLFVYNRLKETRLTVEALQQNYIASDTELFIFADGSKNENTFSKVESVRQYIKTINGFKSVKIIESSENKGLANSIINGVSQLLESYESVIVIEDDLISAPNFLNFMNQALSFYRHDQNIQSISGYSMALKNKTEGVYFQRRPGSWGWATWKDRWNTNIFNKENLKIEIRLNPQILKLFKRESGNDMPKMLIDSINNQNDSWYVRWAFSHFRENHFAVFPARSFIQNIGFSLDSTHCKGINTFNSIPIDNQIQLFHFSTFAIPNKKESHEFINYFTKSHKIFFRIKLLITRTGRKQIIEELKTRMGTS
jgi:hypothetical protein